MKLFSKIITFLLIVTIVVTLSFVNIHAGGNKDKQETAYDDLIKEWGEGDIFHSLIGAAWISMYEDDARNSKDARKALSLAYYYRNDPTKYSSLSIDWLCKAKEFIGSQKLSEKVNLYEFFFSHLLLFVP